MKVVVYLRVSTARQQRSGLGIEAQRHAVATFCAARSCETMAEYVETESGARSDRPQLAKAIDHTRATGSVLVIAKLDRLSRNASFLLALRDGGVKFVAADLPNANELTIGILAVVAQQERLMNSVRTKEALAAAKLRGVVLGNPNGVKGLLDAAKGNSAAVIAIRNQATERAMAIKPILDQVRGAGASSLRDIAEGLNEMGVQTPRGGRWHPTSVKNLIARTENPRKFIRLYPDPT